MRFRGVCVSLTLNFKGFYMFYIIQFDIFDISLIDSRLKDLYVACLFSVTHFEKAKKTHSRSSFHHGSKKPSSSYVPLTFVDV